jgi:hypothetical protein
MQGFGAAGVSALQLNRSGGIRMKLKALLLACAVAGASASFAFADDGHGNHGKHHEHGTTSTSTTTVAATTTTTTTTTASDCQRVSLRGTLASVSASSFTLTVTRASDAAQALVGKVATVAVDTNTRVRWSGTGTLTGPNVGDSARVKANSCGTAGTLTAKSVRAEGPNAGDED